MDKTFLDIQKEEAKENFNYFFMKLITKILHFLFKVVLLLLINEIFDYIIINIICFLTINCFIYSMYKTYNSYNEIMQDIKKSINEKDVYYELDFNELKNSLFRKEVNYGK